MKHARHLLRFDSLLMAISLFCIQPACSQPSRGTVSLTGKVPSDLLALLPQGTFKAAVMDSTRQMPRQIELNDKLMAGIRQHPEWFAEFRKQIIPGQPMPYHKNTGLSKAEYKELQTLMTDIELVCTVEVPLTIRHDGSEITFKTSGKLKVLEQMSIQISDSSIRLGKGTLRFADVVKVNTTGNALKSEWTGYRWEYKNPPDMDEGLQKDPPELPLEYYKITIARLAKNNRTYVSLNIREWKNGQLSTNVVIPFIIE